MYTCIFAYNIFAYGTCICIIFPLQPQESRDWVAVSLPVLGLYCCLPLKSLPLTNTLTPWFLSASVTLTVDEPTILLLQAGYCWENYTTELMGFTLNLWFQFESILTLPGKKMAISQNSHSPPLPSLLAVSWWPHRKVRHPQSRTSSSSHRFSFPVTLREVSLHLWKPNSSTGFPLPS